MNITTAPDKNDTKRILLGLICNADFCRVYFSLFPNPVFTELGARLVESWCKAYYKKYSASPGSEIKTLYDKAVRNKTASPDELVFVEDLLKKYSGEHVDESVDFLRDLAIEEANRRQLQEVKDSLSIALEQDDIEKASGLLENYKKIESNDVDYIVPFVNTDKVITDAFAEDGEAIIEFKDDLGMVFNSILKEETLVLARGKAKAKKSFFLNWIGVCSLFKGKKTLYINCGDLTSKDVMRRLFSSITYKSFYDLPSPIKQPQLDCYKNVYGVCQNIKRICNCPYKDSNGVVNKNYTPCTACKGERPFPFTVTHSFVPAPIRLTESDVVKCVNMVNSYVKVNDNFRILNYAPQSLSAKELFDIIKKEMMNNGFVPDIILIDYEGLMKQDVFNGNRRTDEIVEQRFIELTKLRFLTKACIVVGDQLRGRDVEGASGWISDEAYSSSVAKNRYATAVVALNQSDYLSEISCQVLTIPLARNGNYLIDNNTFLLIGQCLSLGQYATWGFIPTVDDIKCTKDFEKENNITNSLFPNKDNKRGSK